MDKIVTADYREKLYNDVWGNPLVEVAKVYEVSEGKIKKECIRLDIPLPPGGYWRKIKSGSKPYKARLPEVTWELKKYVYNYIIRYKDGIDDYTDEELDSEEELHLLKDKTKEFIKDVCFKLKVKAQLRNPNKYILEHKEEILYRKKRDKELNAYGSNLLLFRNSRTVENRRNRSVLPIEVLDCNINRVYRIFNAIVDALEELEGRINVGGYENKDEGCFIIMQSYFYFKFTEKNSKIVLKIDAKYGYGASLNESMEYKDNKEALLENQVGKIIYDMFVIANQFKAKGMLIDREMERRWEAEKKLQQLAKMREEELEKIKVLEQLALEYEKVQKIRIFIKAIELSLHKVDDTNKKIKTQEWINWAKEKVDWLDPLVEKEDKLLGKNKNIFDIIGKMN